jgi:hypothetical protein
MHPHDAKPHAPHKPDRHTFPSACMPAAPSRTMPPRQQNLGKLVRKLGANSPPGEQLQALVAITEGCREGEDFHFLAAIVAVGAIPLLVPLLGPGPRADVEWSAAEAPKRQRACGALTSLRTTPKIASLQPVQFLYWYNCWGLPHRSWCNAMQHVRYRCSLWMLRMPPALLQLALSLCWCSF